MNTHFLHRLLVVDNYFKLCSEKGALARKEIEENKEKSESQLTEALRKLELIVSFHLFF